MGKPNHPCFPQSLNYKDYVESTSTTTIDPNQDIDFFYIPPSGNECLTGIISLPPIDDSNDPELIGDFRKVAVINISNDGCGPYKLVLSGPDASFFKIFGKSLYFNEILSNECTSSTTCPPSPIQPLDCPPEYLVYVYNSNNCLVDIICDQFLCVELKTSTTEPPTSTTSTSTTDQPCPVYDCTGDPFDPVVECPPNYVFSCQLCECIELSTTTSTTTSTSSTSTSSTTQAPCATFNCSGNPLDPIIECALGYIFDCNACTCVENTTTTTSTTSSTTSTTTNTTSTTSTTTTSSSTTSTTTTTPEPTTTTSTTSTTTTTTTTEEPTTTTTSTTSTTTTSSTTTTTTTTTSSSTTTTTTTTNTTEVPTTTTTTTTGNPTPPPPSCPPGSTNNGSGACCSDITGDCECPPGSFQCGTLMGVAMVCCPEVGWECGGTACVMKTTTTTTTTTTAQPDCCGGNGIPLAEGQSCDVSLCPPNSWDANPCVQNGQGYCCCATYGQANCTATGCEELPPGVQGQYSTVFECYNYCTINVWACFEPAYNCAMYQILAANMQPNEYFTEAACDANCIAPPLE